MVFETFILFCFKCADVRISEKKKINENGASRLISYRVKKGKVFPYSLPSVGPGADPGVQAVSPQVT